MLLTICTFCLRHRLQRPPPCHPPPSPILASTYEIDASPPSYPHLSSCHVAISAVSTSPTPYYRYTCSTQLPIDAQLAAMPFMSSASSCHSIHPFDCCCHNDFDAACTHSITSASNQTINTRAVSIRPPKSTRTQCTQRSIKASPSRIHSTTWHHRPHTVPLSTCRIP